MMLWKRGLLVAYCVVHCRLGEIHLEDPVVVSHLSLAWMCTHGELMVRPMRWEFWSREIAWNSGGMGVAVRGWLRKRHCMRMYQDQRVMMG